MNFLLHRRIAISMLFIALTLLGYVSYKQLPVELLPNAELPSLFIQVSSQQEMDPSYIESEIIIPLEGVISASGGVDKIQSFIDSRQSRIQVDFKNNVNFKITTIRLEERINELAATFPEGFFVHTQKVDIAGMSGGFMVLQVRGSGGTDRVRNIIRNEIQSELENIDGIATVSVFGGREKAIEIQLDPAACNALNLTPSQISTILTQNSREKEYVGNITEPDRNYFVHVNAPYARVSDLENIIIAPGPILLKDVATIFFDLKEETSYSRVNGKDAISISLQNDSQANLIELSHKVQNVIHKLNNELAWMDVEIIVQENTAEIMEKNIRQIIDLAISGALLAMLILWFFLKNIRLVFLIALSIPISIYTAFNLFYAFGITINSLTLVGMALAVGMLLDNSIVVLENIYRLSGAGYTPEQSVTQGIKEVWRSILAATLTTVTVFLPFIFSDNFLIKLIGNHIGISIISTLFISLLVALLFIPMATYVILKKKKGKSVFYEKITITQRPVQIYLVLLKTAMRNPGVTIFGAIILFFVTLILSLTLNINQMKEVASDRFNIYVTLPPGTTLENTDKVVQVMEERLEDIPEKEDLICRIQEAEAILTFVLKEDYDRISKRKTGVIKADIQKKLSDLKDVEISINESVGSQSGGMGAAMNGLGSFMQMLGIGNNSERIVIKGSDFDMMQMVAEDIRYFLNEQDYIGHSNVSYQRRQPELLLDPDPVLLLSYEITRADIASGLASLNDEFSSGSTFKVGEDSYDIIIRSNLPPNGEEEETEKRAKTIDDLRALQIQNARGGLHDLQNLTAIHYGRGRARITRVNQDKQIEVFYSFNQGVESSKNLLEAYRSEIDDLILNYNLPSGVAIEVVHEEDLFGDFKFLLFAAFILIFMILASVFESVTTPLVMLFCIPLAAIGSLAALVLTGSSLLNANTLTGFLILLGVVVNNGIILIDYSNILRKQGYRQVRSLMTAGLSRLRPILITSITTIIAMFPLAMGDTQYAGAIGAPFAITVIGGLAFSALLTLVFIPTVAAGLENTLKWYRSLSPKLWILHSILYLAGLTAIYFYTEGLLWQIMYVVMLTSLIPGMTWFAQTSLRKANANVIAPDAEIKIQVRNLVKIYDWPGRFSREWQSGLNIRKRLGLSNEFRQAKDFLNILWQFFLLAFSIYFVYFYLEKKLWIFILSFGVYALIINLWRKIRAWLFYKYQGNRAIRNINRLVFWSIPPTLWFILFRKMENPGLVLVTGILWVVCIAVYVTSRHLYDENINIERVKGRFGGLRRSYFRLVKSIPVIGKKKKPFKALKGVSFEIRTGMFGLLGPNGAGKSTMMRIVCGIFEQSYGSIWINGLDTRVYREELQSLIGFLPQEFGTYEHMSSWEFLDYQAILKGIADSSTRKERLEYVLRAVHMYEKKDDQIGSFSGGMKQRIGIALILLHLPRILIVDEPTAGLDPRERIRFRNLLVELSKDRIVIFSTHIIEDISSSCNQVVVVNKGELKYFGDPGNMIRMAEGKIWNFRIDRAGFEKLDPAMIIHHIQNDDIIQVRYLSAGKPLDEAIAAEPNLEDAYLCLLKNMYTN